jgi:transglutaminase-like putative cysteine protease
MLRSLFMMGAALAWLVTSAHAAGESAAPETARTFRFTYSVQVRDIPAGAHRISIWAPVPKSDPHQEVVDLQVKTPLPYEITVEKDYGNRVVHLGARTPLPGTIDLEMEATVTRRAYSVFAGASGFDEGDPTPRDLAPNDLVPTDGKIAALAHEVTAKAQTPLDKARAIYSYVTTMMRYDKTGAGWGRGDAVYACDAKRGNCTDFHSLIIGMARAVNIPARFVMGFPVPEDERAGAIPGYHCWAELYVAGIGWLPVDSSEASKHPEKRDFFFGGLDANRVAFTEGRDLELEPPASTKLNFFVYPRVEVDGVEFAGVERSFSFSELER